MNKKLIKNLWRELKIQKSRRNSIIKQSSANVAQLLKTGRHDEAFAKVEHLYKDMCIECAYNRVDQFSAQVYRQVQCISKNCDLPTEVNKAISSLVFASSVCEDLQELRLLQNLFRDRYGSEFVKTNVGLLPGNLVDEEMKENLCINSVPDDVKLRLMSAIADDHLIEPRPWESRQMIKVSECEEMTRKSVSSHSGSDCESSMRFSCEPEDSFDSTGDSSSSSEVDLEYQKNLCMQYSVPDAVELWLMSVIADDHLREPRPLERRQMIEASECEETMRKSKLSDSESDCESLMSFSFEYEGRSDGTNGSTSSYGLDFEDSSDSTSGSSSSSEEDF
ncbi:uncharacterized protein LOC132309748 [Cornus florida]|uniref:uncharacterized protein LOC132309748 n=1 Tax=Cornus florida TaxID=4283 RepID=UPI0028984F87|nr:uncharacterized protein LOC132309748 [Cornus florida]